jgi:hypothetical protein
MNLDEEVVLDTIPEAEMLKRTDEPFKKEGFGHCGAHIIHVYQIPKMVLIGEPYRTESGVLWQMSEESEDEFEWEIDVLSHHTTCDDLPYGVECALDAYLCHDGWTELLESSEFCEPFTESPEGFWKVWVCWERSWVDNWNHYGWDYDQYLDFARLTEEEQEKYV